MFTTPAEVLARWDDLSTRGKLWVPDGLEGLPAPEESPREKMGPAREAGRAPVVPREATGAVRYRFNSTRLPSCAET